MRDVAAGISAIRRTESGFARVYRRDLPHGLIETAGVTAAAFLAIRHPHLYPVSTIGELDGALAVFGPAWVSLPELAPIRDHVIGVVAQIARGLAALHARGIVHRGVRRAAVVCVSGSEWGLRNVLVDGDSMARDSNVVADIRGIGELLHELLVGERVPFGDPNLTRDPELDALVLRLLGVGRSQPANIADVLDELEQIGWQRTTDQPPQPNHDGGTHRLVVVSPDVREILLDRRRTDVWTRRWADADCELWRYQTGWFVAARGNRRVDVDDRRIESPDRVPLATGAVVTTDDVTFVLAPELAVVAERSGKTAPGIWVERRTARPSATISPPSGFGDWAIVEVLASGGTAEAFRVRNSHGAVGIAKRLLPETAHQVELRARFEREIDVLRRLRHLAIPRLLDRGTDFERGSAFFVMEDAGRVSVASRLAEGPLPIGLAVAVVRDVLAALDAAHAHGISHRDLKPANVFLPIEPGGFAKLVDFGIARTDGGDAITRSGALLGTPAYMSPEQARGLAVGPEGDVYAAGCFLYEMLAGAPPFAGAVAALLEAHVAMAPPPLPAAIPTELAEVVAQMLAKDPAKRSSCKALRRRLARFVETPGAVPLPELTGTTRPDELAPGIFEWPVSTTLLVQHHVVRHVAIDVRDLRDGPRLRRESLSYLARTRAAGFVSVDHVATPDRSPWRVFAVSAPETIPSSSWPLGLGRAVAVVDAVRAAIAPLVAEGRDVGSLRPAQLHAWLGAAGDHEILVGPIDDWGGLSRDTGATPASVIARILALAAVGTNEPPHDWPAPLRELVHQVRAGSVDDLQLVDQAVQALEELPMEPDWRAELDRRRTRPRRSAPDHVAPPPTPAADDGLQVTRGRVEVGGQIGSWRVLAELGRGGMGCTYEVEHVVIGKRAVAKTLLEQSAGQSALVGRFVDEARAVNAFRHPNIVDVFDIGQDDRGMPYMVMEHVIGESLATRIGRTNGLPIVEVIEIARQVASALAAAHEVGVIHRDLKPANLVVNGSAPLRIKIIDFGIARLPRATVRTGSGTVMGTPAYMPPEQWRSATETDARSDIYALGMTMYEMLTATTAYSGASVDELYRAMSDFDVRRLAWPRGRPPAALAALIERMLARHPDERPTSCADVIAELDVISPARPASAIEDELRHAGLDELRADAMTAEGLPRFRARDRLGPVTVYLAPPGLRGLHATARINALRYLARDRSPLFVTIEAEHALPSGTRAFVRRDPVPPPLVEGQRLSAGPALAVVAVAYRALATQRFRGRNFENFSAEHVRATTTSAATFACMLQPPQMFDREAEAAATMAGNQYVGDVHYASPGAMMGSEHPHDVAYCAGVLGYELLSGGPPLQNTAMYEITQRKASEDPPRLASRCAVSPAIGDFIDRLVARDPTNRMRPPAAIEAELLGLLAGEPSWQAAAERVLAAAPSLADIVVEEPVPTLRAVEPVLVTGERVAGWTIQEHLRTGGDAEVYVVTDHAGLRGILKLWFATDLDPYSDAWDRFRRGMLECAKLPGFPAIRELAILTRGRPRAFAVFDEITGSAWGELSRRDLASSAMLAVAIRYLETLAVAHEHLGVIGDVSPSNVIVEDRDGTLTPILLDVLTPGRPREQIAGYGTPGYLAPEIVDSATPSPSSDLFSAGVLIAELALARRLFPDLVDGLAFPVGGFGKPIEQVIVDAHARHGPMFAAVLARMLALDPAERFTSALAATAALRDVADRARVRESSRLVSGSSSLLGLERRLPRPIAQALRTWRITSAPQDRIRLGFGIAELAARYLASLALADYLAGPRIPAIEAMLPDLRRPLTFGTWLGLGRAIGRALGERGNAFVPELVEFFAPKSKGLAAIEAVIPIRNRASHGRPVLPEGNVDELAREVAKHLTALLDALRFLCSYPVLVSIDQRVRRDGQFDGTYLDLHGSSSEPDNRRMRSGKPAPDRVVIMTDPELRERLILEPFIAHRACERCGVVNHTYVIAGATDKGEVKYHDQASDHEHRERPSGPGDLRVGLHDLLADREALRLREPLDVMAADAERFWSGESPVKPGQVLDGVILEEEIGRGAMGVVYRAREVALGRVCAVKIVRPEVLGEDRKPLHRLQDEARKLARLGEHPHVVRVFRFGIMPDETNCYIVMELLEGGSLDDRLRGEKAPSLDEVLAFGGQLIDAVRYVHASDLVHRDLKPANVLFAGPTCVKVVDFGMARDLRASTSLTVGFAGATPLYCAPEQQAGGDVGRWTDVYALGLLLFDLVIGRPPSLEPLRRAVAIRRVHAQLRAGEPSASVAHHGGDPRLTHVLAQIVRMTEAEPEKRPAITEIELLA